MCLIQHHRHCTQLSILYWTSYFISCGSAAPHQVNDAKLPFMLQNRQWRNPPDRILYMFLVRKNKFFLLLASTEIQMQKQDLDKWDKYCSFKQNVLTSRQVSTTKLSKCFIALQIDHTTTFSPSQKLFSILSCHRSKLKLIWRKRNKREGKEKRNRGRRRKKKKRGCPKFHCQPLRYRHRILHICIKTLPIWASKNLVQLDKQQISKPTGLHLFPPVRF